MECRSAKLCVFGNPGIYSWIIPLAAEQVLQIMAVILSLYNRIVDLRSFNVNQQRYQGLISRSAANPPQAKSSSSSGSVSAPAGLLDDRWLCSEVFVEAKS